MATCDSCGTTIVFGGVREGGYRFCNQKCRDRAVFLSASAQLPDEFVIEKVRQVHEGACAKCGGRGPVDVHTSHSIWSALVMTKRRSTPQVCCQSCGTKAKLQGVLSSGLLGWWGFPWGLVITPVQILRNVGGLFKAPDPAAPSDELVKMVRGQLSAQLLHEESRGGDGEERGPSPAR